MANAWNLSERMLSHDLASTSSRRVCDVKPARSLSRQQLRVRAAAVQSPSKTTPKASVIQVKEQDDSPGRVFLSSTRAAAGQLWGVLKFFQAEEEACLSSETDSNIMAETTKRANQANEVQEKAKAKGRKKPPADINRYLRPAGLMETRYARLMASLCAQTYSMEKLTNETLWRKHHLHLITTSREFQKVDAPKSALQTMEEGDGMVSSTQAVESAQKEVVNPSKPQLPAPTLATIPKMSAQKPKGFSPTDLVNQGLAAAAAAAANAAAPFAYIGNAVPFKAVTSRMQSAAAAGQSTAVATIATVTAAVSSNFNKEHSKTPKASQAADPTEWFVCDDPVSHTRYFVLQGSQTIEHWRLNLSFDPVVFEDPELGIKVHRGVYVAAEILYQRFLPMVEEQLASSPFTKVAFTGHSLGGSLGTLLMMMYKHRGVLPQAAIAPVFTFGAPAIFCDGGCFKGDIKGCGPLPASEAAKAVPADDTAAGIGTTAAGTGTTAVGTGTTAAPATSATEPVTDEQGQVKDKGALQALGLEAGIVRNIFMNRDIVPRAFACDYTLVADLLRRVGDGFRDLDNLMGNGRVVMYFFVGKMLILQPDRDHDFVHRNEMYHDMLPARPGLWVLRQPQEELVPLHRIDTPPSLAAMARGRTADDASHAAVKVDKQLQQQHLQAQAPGADQNQSSSSSSISTIKAVLEHPVASLTISGEEGQPAASLKEAVMDLMNYPHPLDTLGEPSAYGPHGAISRYHDPEHYCQAIGGVLRARTKPLRMDVRSPRWYLNLQKKERAMKHKVRNLRRAQVDSVNKERQQLQDKHDQNPVSQISIGPQ